MDLIELEYRAKGAASALFRSPDDEVLIEGPAGTGKTRAVLEKINWYCDAHPGVRVLIVRDTRVSLTESVLVTWESKVLWPGHPALRGDASRANRHSYIYDNGSEVIVGGLDKPDRIMSTEYDLVYVAEATEAKEEAWEKLLTRLRNGKGPYHQAIADCNPGPPGHWLNRRAGDGRMVRLLSRHHDNPSVTAEYLARLAKLTGHRRARLFEGRWVAAEGSVYGADFSRSSHVVKPFAIPSSWPQFLFWDPGYDHPTAILWVAISPTGTYYVCGEIYTGGQSVQQHAATVRIKNQEMGGRNVRGYYGDPFGAFASTAASPQSIQQQLAKEGIHLWRWPAAKGPDVVAGVNLVRHRLQLTSRAEDGGIKVFEDCPHTIAEFESWSYRRMADGSIPAGDDQFEDRDNHAMDCIRGAVALGLQHSGSGVRVYGQE